MTVSIAWCQPDGAYRQNPGIAQSHLKSILISPAHYQAALTRRWQTTPNMLLGSALHCAVLEGAEAFEASYVERPDDIKLNTKEGKEWAALQKNKRKTVLTGEQTQQLKGMTKALQALEWFDVAQQDRLRKFSELSIYWEWCGIDCKARLDRVIELEDKVLVLDLKSTDSVQPKKFIDKVIGLNYMFQAAYYTEAATKAFKKPAEFIFIGVERDAPHSIDYFSPAEDMVAEGHKQCEHALTVLKECILTDDWPNTPPTFRKMHLPEWFKSPVETVPTEETPLF